MKLVYVVEDDTWQAEQLSRTCQEAGFQPAIFANGVEAIKAIDTTLPDVLILDMLLTGTTGITLLHELQSYHDTGTIPVILCTSLADDLSLDDLRPYGVHRILDKTTMQPTDIIAALRSAL